MLALLAALPLAALVPSAHDDPAEIVFAGDSRPLSELADRLAPTELAQATKWSAWGRSHGYEAVLDPSARVLLLNPLGADDVDRHGKPKKKSRADRSALERKLELIEETLAHADALFPMPTDGPTEDGPTEDGPTEDGPTDVRGAPDHWIDGATGEAEHDSLPVLVELRGSDDLDLLLTKVEEEHSYLGAWARGARTLSGFTLSRPLLGAWVVAGDDLEEWSPNHELVNRLTRLLLVERYGRLPRWIDHGLAWQAEMEIHGSIYCFPSRSGFVASLEHRDWDRTLRRLHKKVTDPLEMEEITLSSAAAFDEIGAHRAWGSAEFLVRKRPEAVAPLLADLAKDRLANGRVGERDSWKLIAEYEAPAATQAALLREHVGEDGLEELTEFLRRGAR